VWPDLALCCAQGMTDAQLGRLTEVLRNGRIWALNVGENFRITQDAWARCAEDLSL
jgi:hypothetical protein